MTNPLRLASRVHSLRPTAVNAVLNEVRQLQASGRSVVSLMRGQPDTPTPAHIVEAAERAVRDGRTGYPDNRGEPVLRRAVAEKLQREQGLAYDPDREILITDGATLGLCATLGALLEPGTRVLLPEPIYDAYTGPIALWDGQALPVPAPRRGGRYTIDSETLRKAPRGDDRILLLNTPWNPVGTVLTGQELQDIIRFSETHDLAVLSDEIYEGLVYDGRRHVSPASVSDGARQRTVLINSLSKSYAMTGWRVGYCAGPQSVIDAMLLVLQQSSRGPATFVQDAAACALAGSQECVEQMRAEYQARRDLVLERLRGIPGVDPLKPEGGLFVMVDVRGLGLPSDEVRSRLLLDSGVVVLHGSAYGPGGEGTLRVSFAAGGDTLDRGLERLRDGLMSLAERAPRQVSE